MAVRTGAESGISRRPCQLDRAPGLVRGRPHARSPRSAGTTPTNGHDEAVVQGESDTRPWGSFTVLDDADGYKVKRIVVRPGKRLSYQRHARRSEHWFVVRGRGRVVLDGCSSELTEGMAFDIPVTAAHRIENDGRAD